MIMQRLGRFLIVGIDPGATTGYAVLNLRGRIVELGSKKGAGVAWIVKKLLRLGTPVVFSYDVATAPKLIEKVAAKFGARLIGPKRSLSNEEKKAIVGSRSRLAKNVHQRDALAAALFAVKVLSPLLRRLFLVLKEASLREATVEKVVKIVLKKGLAVREALRTVKQAKFA